MISYVMKQQNNNNIYKQINKLNKLVEEQEKKIQELSVKINKQEYITIKTELIKIFENNKLYILGDRKSPTPYKEYILKYLECDDVDNLYKWYNNYINEKIECKIYIDKGKLDSRIPKEYYNPEYICLSEIEKYRLFNLFNDLFKSKNINII